ncbi:hypothetical protein QBC40DRAFT_328686 [Triangularia verruculosa]|uniref:Uncharacterized protein n=1 Tax=Triangularia verruculosa TaxID=2587418 RepID=A0AAN6XHQ5_9PEZI|nr:hypothetical protein QBC40DRAFT_328686 [Triangularia verruculosa]
MLSLHTIAASALALFSVVNAAPAGLDDVPDVSKYAIVPISWDLPVKLDDPSAGNVTVTGTIQEAIAQMEASYPGWNSTFQSKLQDPSSDPSLGLAASGDPDDHTDCKPKQWKYAGVLSISWGVEYLRELTGTAKNGPGPGECGRVSCSWQSAIWWCNDNDVSKELQWSQIADGAAYINKNCNVEASYVKGQAFYKDKWNVIVRYDNDNC